MNPSAEMLWRLNREYVNRLGRACSYFDLLAQLVLERDADENAPVQALLLETHERLTRLADDHRAWCYGYFYESAETKRMVQSAADVSRALTSFADMHYWHRRDFSALVALFEAHPRPRADFTRVTQGDLWELMRRALHDLLDFSNMLLET